MAQRTVHYLFGELLLREVPVADAPRFLLGSLLPDAFVCREDRDTTHFAVKTADRSWLDYDAFYDRFGGFVREDPLYLGYYMHLFEDDGYRRIMHGKYYDRFTLTSDADLEALYRDYTILNGVIKREFGVSSRLGETPRDDNAKRLYTAIAPLDPEEMKKELARDFSCDLEGELRFLTFDILREYLDEWLPAGVRQMEAILGGERGVPAESFAWRRRARYN